MKKTRIITLLIAIMMVISTVVPFSAAFAADRPKYHPDDWFGYTHSSTEIQQWVKDAVKYPKISDEAVKALTGEIRPGDIISFQVEVEMPSGHQEVVQFLKDWKLNISLPFGANTMIEVYASDVPTLTDEEYQQKINDFHSKMAALSDYLNSEDLLNDIETGKVPQSLYNTYKDMLDNQDKYYEIYLAQLETARTKYGFADDSYGTAEQWMGKFEDNPNNSAEEGVTYEAFLEQLYQGNYVAPSMTQEEYEQAVLNFETEYAQLVKDWNAEYEIAKEEYDLGNISETDWKLITDLMESLGDGTFYETVQQYLIDCRDGYSIFEDEAALNMVSLILAGIETFHAYSGQYSYQFSESKVQKNEPITYIFDVNIVATDFLCSDDYFCLPILNWRYEESCPSRYWVSEGFLKGHWEDYYPCNSRHFPFIKFVNPYIANNYLDLENANDLLTDNKTYPAIEYIQDDQYRQRYIYRIYGNLYLENALKAMQTNSD